MKPLNFLFLSILLLFSCVPNDCCLEVASPNALGSDSLKWDLEHELIVTNDSVFYEIFYDGPIDCAKRVTDSESHFTMTFSMWKDGDIECLLLSDGTRAKWEFDLSIGETYKFVVDGIFQVDNMNENLWVFENSCLSGPLTVMYITQETNCFYAETSSSLIYTENFSSEDCHGKPFSQITANPWHRHGRVFDLQTCPIDANEAKPQI